MSGSPGHDHSLWNGRCCRDTRQRFGVRRIIYAQHQRVLAMSKRFFGPEFRDMSKDAEEAFASVRGDIDRAVEALRGWAAELGGVRPRVDLITTEDGVEIEVELAGLREDQIDVTVTGDVLTIAGEKTRSPSQSADRTMSERAFGRFSRAIKLPYAPDANSVTASYTHGVLRIAVPKPEHLRTKAEKIHVRTA